MTQVYRIALALTVVASVACSRGDEAAPPAVKQPAAQAAAGAKATAASPTNMHVIERDPRAPQLFLNELLFAPRANESAFVEIVNAGSRELPVAGLSLVSGSNEKFVLPDTVGPIAPRGRLLVRFDGTDAVERRVVHTAKKDFLAAQAGTLALVGRGGWLDRVAWGERQRGTVYMGQGGRVAPLTAGTSLARLQSLPGESPGAWVAMPPGQASPGTENPLPTVTALLPTDGVIVRRLPPLYWYTVPGAKSYRVEVAKDGAFTSLVLDQVVQARPGRGLDQVTVQPSGLPDGSYSWRVTPQWDGERASPPSPPATFRLDAALPVAQSKVLSVPPIFQRKDTYMLVVSNAVKQSFRYKDTLQVSESGTHLWDRPYAGAGWEGPYCVRAAAAMLNRFFGGQLSQDRIAYEVHKDDVPGPEEDLPLRGMNEAQISAALRFALGAETTVRKNPRFHEESPSAQAIQTFADQFWITLRTEIAAGRPLVLADRAHVWLAIGTVDGEGGRSGYWYLDGNFAAAREELFASPGNLTKSIDAYWVLPASMNAPSDEDTIKSDADGDGIVDFDEAKRFETNGRAPNGRDSDGDGIEDKVEVRATLFLPEIGYALDIVDAYGVRDLDGDGKAMERDPDSDGDGCLDGLEDLNRDGNYDPAAGESSNFNRWDDACHCDSPGPEALKQLRWARITGFARIESPVPPESGHFQAIVYNANAKYLPEQQSIVIGGIFPDGQVETSSNYSWRSINCSLFGSSRSFFVAGRISLAGPEAGHYDINVNSPLIDPDIWSVTVPSDCVSPPVLVNFSATGKACSTALKGTYVYSWPGDETRIPHASSSTLPRGAVDGGAVNFTWSFIVMPSAFPPEFAEVCDAFDKDRIVDGAERLPADAVALALPLASHPRIERAIKGFIAASQENLAVWGNFFSAAAEVGGLCRSLTDLWLTASGDAETRYRETKDRFAEAQSQWIQQRDAFATSLRKSLDGLATAVEEKDKKIAADLRAMGVRLEKSGFESFARR